MRHAKSLRRRSRVLLVGLFMTWSIIAADAQSATSTSTQPVCGNGILEEGEQCDPGPPGSPNSECCSVDLDCVVFVPRIGKPCRVDRPLGDCETGDLCTAEGICQPTIVPADANETCRPTSGPCDLGESCDGESPECPTGQRCEADAGPLAGSNAIEVTCKAPLTVDKRFKCSAVGFEPAPGSAAQPEPDRSVAVACGSRRYTGKAAARLLPAQDPRAVDGRLTLPLNKAARRVLRDEGSVHVCVVVELKFRKHTQITERRLVTLR